LLNARIVNSEFMQEIRDLPITFALSVREPSLHLVKYVENLLVKKKKIGKKSVFYRSEFSKKTFSVVSGKIFQKISLPIR